jgi:hypothetical protein
MKIRKIESKPRQEVCAKTRAALESADAALAAALWAMNDAGNEMVRNGDGDLKALEEAVSMTLAARRELNA